ncbi:MAG: type II toxin-antitoxin system VapC family toxin [Fimbriimonas sp.]
MYIIGADHPNKGLAQEMLEKLAASRQRLVTDAEVFQEILHRYTAIQRLDAIDPAFALLRSIVDEVFSIDMLVVEGAKAILHQSQFLSARDALHVAVMKTHGVSKILSFDKGFDSVPGIDRIPA